MHKVFFDHNATTKPYSEVLEIMSQTYKFPANASSVHFFGRQARKIIEQARKEVADVINADKEYRVIFTASGTEANNLVINGISGHTKLVSAIEHHSVIKASEEIEIIPVTADGVVNLDILEEKIENFGGKILLSVMYANNETGIIQPVKQIYKICQDKGVLLHVDAAQAYGKIDFQIEEDFMPDFLTISSHKIGGPQGAAAMVVKKSIPPFPIIKGGGQEFGYRSGTENLSAIAGFGKAAVISKNNILQNSKIEKLRDYLEDEISKISSETVFYGKNIERLPNTSYFTMPGVENNIQLIDFDLNNYAVSSGSACSSGKIEPSHVLKAMGVDDKIIKTAIRVSLGNENTEDEINGFVYIWKDLFERNKK